MASVREVYNALKDIANKDERGFVTPAEFNSFAPIAQANIFNELFRQLSGAENLRRRGIDPGRDKSLIKQIKEDLSTFSKTATLTRDNSTRDFGKPDDFAKLIQLSTYGDILMDVTTSAVIPLEFDEEKFRYIIASTLSKPTDANPVAFMDDRIYVEPKSVRKIQIRYYKQPEGLDPTDGTRSASMPKFGFTTSNNKEVYQASTSVDFELPEHYVPQLVEEMARLIGVNLRDGNIYSYGTNQAQAQ